MRIGLINLDNTRFPNIALGKIAAWHKTQGHTVEWVEPMYWDYDRVYASKVFTFSPDIDRPFPCEVIKGGTGYSLTSELPPEIDRMQPDYSIYPNVDSKTAYGFLTRGCPNKCPWCVVPLKEGKIRPYMDVDEIAQNGKRPHLILSDNNILAAGEYGMAQLEKIINRGYRIDFNQAMDARLVNDDNAPLLAKIRWINGMMRFGCDTERQVYECARAMALIDSHREKPLHYLLFTMIGGPNSDLEEAYWRTSYFRGSTHIRISAQPYRDFNNPQQIIPKWQKDMARWTMRREFWTTCDFKDFSPRKGFTCKEYFT